MLDEVILKKTQIHWPPSMGQTFCYKPVEKQDTVNILQVLIYEVLEVNMYIMWEVQKWVL